MTKMLFFGYNVSAKSSALLPLNLSDQFYLRHVVVDDGL